MPNELHDILGQTETLTLEEEAWQARIRKSAPGVLEKVLARLGLIRARYASEEEQIRAESELIYQHGMLVARLEEDAHKLKDIVNFHFRLMASDELGAEAMGRRIAEQWHQREEVVSIILWESIARETDQAWFRKNRAAIIESLTECTVTKSRNALIDFEKQHGALLTELGVQLHQA